MHPSRLLQGYAQRRGNEVHVISQTVTMADTQHDIKTVSPRKTLVGNMAQRSERISYSRANYYI